MCFPIVSGVPVPQDTKFEWWTKWLEELQKQQKPKPDLLKIAREVSRQF